MKFQPEGRVNSRLTHPSGFNWRAAGLIAGLALLPSCSGLIQREVGRPEVQAVEPERAARHVDEPRQDECIHQAPTKDYLSVSRMLGTCPVKVGDELQRLNFHSEISGFLAIVVEGIDNRGVGIGIRMEAGLTQHQPGRGPIWHIDYGETKTIGPRVSGPGAVNDPIQFPDLLVVRADRGSPPDSAILIITKPDDGRK